MKAPPAGGISSCSPNNESHLSVAAFVILFCGGALLINKVVADFQAIAAQIQERQAEREREDALAASLAVVSKIDESYYEPCLKRRRGVREQAAQFDPRWRNSERDERNYGHVPEWQGDLSKKLLL